MNLSAIKAELEADPLNRGYADMTDAQAADSLNTADIAEMRSIGSAELLAWAGQSDRAKRVRQAANQGVKPDGLTNVSAGTQSVAIVADRMLTRDETQLDLSLSDRQQMLDALVADGILTQADKDSLTTLATMNISRARQLGLPQVRPYHVTKARAR